MVIGKRRHVSAVSRRDQFSEEKGISQMTDPLTEILRTDAWRLSEHAVETEPTPVIAIHAAAQSPRHAQIPGDLENSSPRPVATVVHRRVLNHDCRCRWRATGVTSGVTSPGRRAFCPESPAPSIAIRYPALSEGCTQPGRRLPPQHAQWPGRHMTRLRLPWPGLQMRLRHSDG